MSVRSTVALLPLLAGLLATACDGSHPGPEHEERLAFLHEDAHSGEHGEGDEVPTPGDLIVPDGFEEIEAVPVRLDGHDFSVATRAGALVPGLVQAPCTECHGPEGARPLPPADGEDAPRPAHWQIERAHGSAPLGCASCHAPEDPATLRVPTVVAGDAASEGWPIEHSYRLCGTCHFGQMRDWAGGAHGKRLAGWSGPRVVAPCTACHEPHDPGLPQRLPATFSPPPDESIGDE